MNWLIFVGINVIFDSLRIFIDNFTSDYYFKGKGAVSQKLFGGYAYLIVAPIIALICGADFAGIAVSQAFIIIIAGIVHSIAGVPYFKALEIEDSTNLGIFIQLAPVLYLILGWFFLGDTFSPMQLVAFAVILAAPILIVTTARKKSRKVKLRAIFYALLYVVIHVISSLVFVKVSGESVGFINGIVLVLIGKGIGNLLIIYTQPKLHMRFYHVIKKSKKKLLIPLFANSIIAIVSDFSYRASLVAAPAVAMASAVSDSAEPIVIFFMGIVLTLIWPKFGREKLDKKTVCVHFIATGLVVVGVVLLQL